MKRIITFSVTRIGASHIKSGKPCQDYSLDWQSDDGNLHVAIVCDGHGGDTYVRSDRGARLAAEIALRNIREMVGSVSPTLFLDKKGAVTARPEEEKDDLFPTPVSSTHKNMPLENNVDTEDIRRQQEEQDQAFYAAVAPIREQDQVFNRLFARIYLQWEAAIKQDAQNDPFCEWEKNCLQNARIAKAYGTTLMAFVRTPLYWFAFHIGDGKMLCCDTNFHWSEPVPWDCNCFLNITTSLCGNNPLHSFRYAFSGKGDFPAAVIMGSDGLDDSWCTMERLQNFYSQTLSIFNDLKEKETLLQLGEYLSHLSEKGSRDDMSMAGIIDMEAIATGANVYKKQRELNTLYKERKEYEEKLRKLTQKLEETTKEYTRLEADCQAEQKRQSEILQIINIHKHKLEVVSQQLEQKAQEKLISGQSLNEAEHAFQEWVNKAHKQKLQLETEYNELIALSKQKDIEEMDEWERRKEDFLKERQANKMQALSKKAAYMEQCNEEAMKRLHEVENLKTSDTEEESLKAAEIVLETDAEITQEREYRTTIMKDENK